MDNGQLGSRGCVGKSRGGGSFGAERGYSMQDYITFLSIAALGMLLLLFVCVDIFRRRKDRQKSEQNASHSTAGKQQTEI